MTRRPGTKSSKRLDRPSPSRPPFLVVSFFLLFSYLRSSPHEPRRCEKRSSYSFVRPNFYERLPARESRNCLFSGIPGTSWSRPRRHREIESSSFSLFLSSILLPSSPTVFLSVSPFPDHSSASLLAPRFTFVTMVYVAKHGKRCYYKRTLYLV